MSDEEGDPGRKREGSYENDLIGIAGERDQMWRG
jgi:hypothetical protein